MRIINHVDPSVVQILDYLVFARSKINKVKKNLVSMILSSETNSMETWDRNCCFLFFFYQGYTYYFHIILLQLWSNNQFEICFAFQYLYFNTFLFHVVFFLYFVFVFSLMSFEALHIQRKAIVFHILIFFYDSPEFTISWICVSLNDKFSIIFPLWLV